MRAVEMLVSDLASV